MDNINEQSITNKMKELCFQTFKLKADVESFIALLYMHTFPCILTPVSYLM